MNKSLVTCFLTHHVDVAILNVSTAKGLGVSIDYHLDYSNHINCDKGVSKSLFHFALFYI